MALKTGSACKAYYNSGTDASPTWVEITLVGDVNLSDLGTNLAEVNLRASSYVLNLAAKLHGSVEMLVAYNPANTAMDALLTAFFAKTVYQFAFMDGNIATAGSEGFKAFCIIESFPIQQPLEGMVAIDTMRLALAYEEESNTLVEPSWYTVT
jgi:hypothetical protein